MSLLVNESQRQVNLQYCSNYKYYFDTHTHDLAFLQVVIIQSICWLDKGMLNSNLYVILRKLLLLAMEYSR